MSNKKQTSVEFLEEALSIHFTQEQQMQFLGLFIQAKELHRQEIMDAHHCGRNFEYKYPASDKNYDESAEQYYRDTYETIH